MRLCLVSVILALLLPVFVVGCKDTDDQVGVTPSQSVPTAIQTPAAVQTTAAERASGNQESAVLSENILEGVEHFQGFKLLMRMTDGIYKEEKEPGPFQGWHWEGKFALELVDGHGKIISSLDLNDAFGETPLTFHETFTIPFRDYNNDGAPEFTIGQYASSNLFMYRLFTVKPDGVIYQPVSGVSELMSSERTYSAAFSRGALDSFTVPVYDNASGKHRQDRYEWREGTFRLVATSDQTPLAKRDLKVQTIDEPNGFRLAFNEFSDPVVRDTFSLPGTKSIVHIVRRADQVYRQDAVVMEPDTRQYRIIPLMNAPIHEIYSVDSLVGPVGFLADGRLAVITVYNDQTGNPSYYRVEAVDMSSGFSEVLIDRVADVIDPDFFAAKWLSKEANMIMINSHGEGKMWRVDLENRSDRVLESRYSHDWPLILTYKSPDGGRFWYANRLHDLDGRIIGEAKQTGGMEQYWPYIWSPDGKYSVYMYTHDEKETSVISSENARIVAPQALRFIHRDGETVALIETGKGNDEGRYADVVGWLNDPNAAIVEYYELERVGNSEPRKVRKTYKLLDLQNGMLSVFKAVDRFDNLQSPEWIIPQALANTSSQAAIAVDRQECELWRLDVSVEAISGWVSDAPLWAANDYNRNSAVLYQYDASFNALQSVTLSQPLQRGMYQDGWLFNDATDTYFDLSRLFQPAGTSAQPTSPPIQPKSIGIAPLLSEAVLKQSNTDIVMHFEKIEQWTLRAVTQMYPGLLAITETQKEEIIKTLEQLFGREEAKELFAYQYKQMGNVYEDLPGDHFPIGDLNLEIDIVQETRVINERQMIVLTLIGKHHWKAGEETVFNDYKKQYWIDKDTYKILDQNPKYLPL